MKTLSVTTDFPGLVLIGIAGRKRQGKDTIALMIKDLLPQAQIVSFASPLKQGISAMLRIPLDEVEVYKDTDHPLIDAPLRDLMVDIGTNLLRNSYKQDVWVDIMYRRIADMYAHGERLIVIPDVRFENEASMIRHIGGEIWHVTRNGFDSDLSVWRSLVELFTSPHPEMGIKHHSQDTPVYNIGSMPVLREKAKSLMRTHFPQLFPSTLSQHPVMPFRPQFIGDTRKEDEAPLSWSGRGGSFTEIQGQPSEDTGTTAQDVMVMSSCADSASFSSDCSGSSSCD
jgi:hypothetical protein